jgi:pimeloyl-ACP methyl ester carboxylesterase
MPTVDLGDQTLEYRTILGAADRPPLVFLHEGLGSASLWRDFPDKLCRRVGARGLVYSRAGYGRSSGLRAKRSPAFMHDEALDVLPQLLARLGIVRPLLIGHSDGASIALIHAATHAAAVSGLVLMAPHVFVEAVTLAAIARIAETYETSDLRARLAQHHDHVDDAFHGWSDIWLSPRFTSWQLGAEVQRLTVPTLLIQGEDDAYGTLAQLDAFEAARAAKVTRLVLRACGHSPHRDQEALVLDAIAAFVKGAGASD